MTSTGVGGTITPSSEAGSAEHEGALARRAPEALPLVDAREQDAPDDDHDHRQSIGTATSSPSGPSRLPMMSTNMIVSTGRQVDLPLT